MTRFRKALDNDYTEYLDTIERKDFAKYQLVKEFQTLLDEIFPNEN